MFHKHFQSELAYLRQLGREFAAAHPNTAGMLSERSSDPDVERLLEGFAFLTAKLRARVEASAPELIHGLADLLAPHYLRPIPATSIAQFTAHKLSRERVRIPAGTELGSVPVHGTSCLFRTTTAVDLLPLELLQATSETLGARHGALQLQFRMDPAGKASVFHPGGLRLFLHGPLPSASLVLLWLLRHCRGIAVQAEGAASAIRLPPDSITHAGLRSPLLPWPSAGPPGPRLVLEYFTLPEHLLFVDLMGLDRAADAAAERFTITFELEDPPRLPARLATDAVRLHCAPVINLFPGTAEPIRVDPLISESLLRPAELPARHASVFAVTSVTGVQRGRAERRRYQSFADHGHDPRSAFYQLHRVRSPLDDALDTYLRVDTPQDTSPLPAEETLSVELTCTNRALPAELGVGDIRVPTASSPTGVRFTNVTPVSKPVDPPLDGELHWRLLAQLSLGQRSRTSAETVRASLALYNLHAETDLQQSRVNQARVDSIRSVESGEITRMLAGCPVRGVQVRVSVDEARLGGAGDAFLLGCVLDEWLATSVAVNAFTQLTLLLHPSGASYTWPARGGDRPIV